MAWRSSDLQSDSDLDSIRKSCDVFDYQKWLDTSFLWNEMVHW